MSCHQWCECPKCTTFSDSCGNEIKNPHTGTFSESSEERIKDLEQKLANLTVAHGMATNQILQLGKSTSDLLQKLAKAIEALEFYGDTKNWDFGTIEDCDTHRTYYEEDTGFEERAGGKRARRVLKEIKEPR